jgi:menaquinone-specific isochorismate synthase
MDRAGSESQATTADAEPPTASRTVEVADVSFQAFLESREPPRTQWATAEGLEMVASGAAARVEPGGEDRFETVRERAATVFDALAHEGPAVARPRAFGGFSFFPVHEPAPPWEGFPPASFVVPAVQLTRAADRTWLTVTASDESALEDRLAATRETLAELPAMQPTGGPPGVAATSHRTPREAWTTRVADAVERIRADGLRKVVLATALDVDLETDISPPAVLERLRRTYPECYRFLLQPTEAAGFFGAPPERLVELEGRTVETEALAGSVERGDTPEEDAALAASLLESDKLQEEQGLVVDAIRDDLAPLGDVEVGDQTVRKLTNIQHLQTPITAELSADAHVLSVVAALHPTPAVGGVPREMALELIGETETFERGWYAAPVGWFDGDGDGEFAVGIRSGTAGGDWATLFAGNGIVADSDPDEEWAEIAPKFRPILDELDADKP